jgi:ribonuclease P protein component
MFKRKYRINAGRFLEIIQKGNRKTFPFGFIYKLETGLPGKIAVSVPKKTEKSSVSRHRIKRRISHAFSKHSLPKADIVVMVRPGTDKMSFEELVSITLNVLQ